MRRRAFAVAFAPMTWSATTSQRVQRPSGAVYVDNTAVATITVDASGLVHAAAIGTPANLVTGGTLDPNTGLILLQWAAVPTATSSVQWIYQFDAMRPNYGGPDDATETVNDIIARRRRWGLTVANAAAGNTYFGERTRSDQELAFDDASSSIQESGLTAAAPVTLTNESNSTESITPHNLGTLPGLSVPNLLPSTSPEIRGEF